MPNYNVYLEGAWLVKDVATGEDAIGIAISEAGKRLNPKLEFVGVDVGTMNCAGCGDSFMSVYVVADTALVGLLFQMKVYEAESEEHASRIATSVIGKALRDVPLRVADVEEFLSDSRPQPKQGGSERGRTEYRDRTENRDRSESRGRTENHDRSESRGRSENRDRSESRGRSENRDRSENHDRTENRDRSESRGRSDYRDRTERRDRPDHRERNDSFVKNEQGGRSDRRDSRYEGKKIEYD